MKTLFTLLVAAILGNLVPLAAQQNNPRGIVVYRTSYGQADEFCSATEFLSYEPFSQTVTFRLSNKPAPFRLLRSDIVEIIDYPDFAAGVFTYDQDRPTLDATILKFAALGKKHPNAKLPLSRWSTAIQQLIDQLAAGQVLMAGRWLLKSEYDKMMAPRDPLSQAPPSIENDPNVIQELRYPTTGKREDDVVYKHVRIMAVEPSGVKFRHDGGVTTVALESLPTDLRAKYRLGPANAQRSEKKEPAPAIVRSAPAADLAPSDESSERLSDYRKMIIDAAEQEAAQSENSIEKVIEAAEDEFSRITADATQKQREAAATLSALEGKYPADEQRRIKSLAGEKRWFSVIQKLDFANFPGFQKYGSEIYEVRFVRLIQVEQAILATGPLRFEEPNIAVTRVVPSGQTVVRKVDGFDKAVTVYREGDPAAGEKADEIDSVRLKAQVAANESTKLNRMAMDIRTAADTQAQELKRLAQRIRERGGFQAAALVELDRFLAPRMRLPRLRLSARLQGLQFSVKVSDPKWKALQEKNYRAFFELAEITLPIDETGKAQFVANVIATPFTTLLKSEHARLSSSAVVVLPPDQAQGRRREEHLSVSLVTVNALKVTEAGIGDRLTLPIHINRLTNGENLHPDGNGIISKVSVLRDEALWAAEKFTEPELISSIGEFRRAYEEEQEAIQKRIQLGEITEAQGKARLQSILDKLPALVPRLAERF